MIEPSSFRDPSGFIIYEREKIMRIVNSSYSKNYLKLMSSGLYEKLVSEKKLVSHKEVEAEKHYSKDQFKVLELDKIQTITYPYEWCFSQFKEAALLTLEIQRDSVEYGLTLKDATPYNVQFENNSPIFIDTLSFEEFSDNYVWKPYKQFCEMFLGPLCLMVFNDMRLCSLLISNINGIPLDLVNKLLPLKSKFNPSIFFHLVLQNSLSKKGSNKKQNSNKKISKKQHLAIIQQLESFVKNLKLKKTKTEWGNYHDETIQEKPQYVYHKEKIIRDFISKVNPKITWDIGSNDGNFSKIAAEDKNSTVYSLDFDWKCIEHNYIRNKKENKNNIFPLLLDLANPSPPIGWMNQERSSIYERLKKPDVIMGLALIHHVINLNIPVSVFIDVLSLSKRYVILEYVPFEDPKCQQIFRSRGDEFEYVSNISFEEIITKKFSIIESIELKETKRKLYFLEKC